MIEDSVYKELLENGLLLDHYFLLCNMKNGRKLVETRRMEGFINLLTKKEFIKDNELTEKGLDLVQNCIYSQPIPTEAGVDKSITDFGTWADDVYRKCQDKLYELTKSRQIRTKIEKKAYPFLPNSTDMAKKLGKVIQLYKLNDYKRIEDTLLRYITTCASSNNWFPLLHYYILKEGSSQMVTDIQNYDEDQDDQDFKSTQKFV